MTDVTARDELQTLAGKLQAVRQFQRVYPPGHPRLVEAQKDCHSTLQGLLRRYPKLQIAYAQDEFVIGSVQVPARSETLQKFARTLEDVGVGRLVFTDGLRQWEVQRFLDLLAADRGDLESRGGIEQAVREAGIEHIEAGRLSVDGRRHEDPDVLFRTWEAYSTGLRIVRALRSQARTRGVLESLEEAKQFVAQLVYLGLQETRPLLAVHALKVNDEYTFTHSVNVAMLTVAMACSLPFEREQLEPIGLAALLHDIGKERVPREILQKPGKLTPEEWQIMKLHSLYGAQMLAKAEGVGDLAPVVAYEHHLAYQSDLPGFGQWPLNLVSQIVALADVYDALRSVRPYQTTAPPDTALEIMARGMGTKFDPDLFDGFSRMVGYYPPGTCVRLQSGALGISHTSNPHDPRRPRVALVQTPAGERIDPPELLDLGDPDSVVDAIAEVIDATAVGIDPLSVL